MCKDEAGLERINKPIACWWGNDIRFMDGEIAAKENLKLLKESLYSYIVIERIEVGIIDGDSMRIYKSNISADR